jgi:ribosomal protein S16
MQTASNTLTVTSFGRRHNAVIRIQFVSDSVLHRAQTTIAAIGHYHARKCISFFKLVAAKKELEETHKATWRNS